MAWYCSDHFRGVNDLFAWFRPETAAHMKSSATTAPYIQKAIQEHCLVVRLAKNIGSSWKYEYTSVYEVRHPEILKLS